jgi:uncharacterized membrane protein YgcG
MKKCILLYMVAGMGFFCLPAFSQSKTDTASLGLPGDNLDLYAVLDLFLKSKTIEGFEKSLNDTKSKINNLDLDLDGKVDFIKVVTKKEDSNAYTFILQDAVSKTETQDVAVILVNRDKNKKISVQIVGDEDLYGKDYVIEPKTSPSPAVTANPAYVGSDPVTKDVPASTTTIVVQSAPIVQYVYSPVYVPYYPPYYYGYYPPYFAMATVIAVGIYRHNNWYHHGGYYGGHYGGHYGGGNTVIINNHNQINHYNNTRNTSNQVQHNTANGNYGNRGSASTRPSNGASASTRPSNGPSASTRPSNGASASTRPSNGPSASTRQSSSNFSSRANSSSGAASNRGSGGGFSGGGGNGGSRGGGGGRRR